MRSRSRAFAGGKAFDGLIDGVLPVGHKRKCVGR